VVKIKYMGSKSRIAKYIVPIIQKYINENDIAMYIEPFVGG
jgi:DNA adenine methylase